jgi:thiamine biosynthesis lipoprotein ApbE
MRAARHFPFRAMGSPCELRLYGTDAAVEAAAETAISEVRRLEAKYSRYRDDSLTARIVAQAGNPAGIEVDDETAALLDYAEAAWRKSEGRFDITSGVLRRAWNWKSGALPSQAQIDALLPLIARCYAFPPRAWSSISVASSRNTPRIARPRAVARPESLRASSISAAISR